MLKAPRRFSRARKKERGRHANGLQVSEQTRLDANKPQARLMDHPA